MTTPVRLAALASLAPLLAACVNPFASTSCTTEARPALNVVAFDARSGAPFDGGYTVVARSDGFVETAIVPTYGEGWDPQWGALLAHERAGRYEVTVSKPGYALWRRTGVEVGRGECHVRTVKLEARLEPAQ
ncbi:MAG TPA: hypothetical protein VHG51_07110 [Longimicrobiaceae bacterium]|nr:hypothetical protein [Longimicrobiaceae bacterium]